GFIPNSIFIGVEGSFATWLGTILKDIETPVLFVADKGKEAEVATRMARIGFDNNLGYLEGGIDAWKNAGKELDLIESISPDKFASIHENNTINILDIRKESEFNSEHIVDAINAPLDYYNDQLSKINSSEDYYVHCLGGYRSVIFISLLKSKGFQNLINVQEGFDGIKKTNKFEITEYVCPTTLL
ncbi:MAG: MBL fold metallo-hydrolase, partial [Bacteroidia bacterium]|nr:MBL fold metallo-hydrolase [Bacteroidia bacterium]